MNGINLLLDSNHINKANAFKAAQQITTLDLSVSSLNYYITQALDIEEELEHGFKLPKIEDAETAKRILAYMAQTAIPKNVEKFDLKAYNVFLTRVGLPVVSFEMESNNTEEHITATDEEIIVDEPPVVLHTSTSDAVVESDEEDDENESIVFDFGPPTSIETMVATATMAKPSKKEGKGRRSNPNSAVSVAKQLYAESADKTRDTIIKLFQDKLGLESGTAMTYYYIARKQ